jgi:phage baseplate assembly protein W
MTNIAFPYQIDGGGRTALATDDDHIRDMIQQLLFTSAGERVNRPTFGTALQQLVFAPNSPEVAAATQFLVQGALQQYLGDLIVIEQVSVDSEDATLSVTVTYMVRRTQQRDSTTFVSGSAS